MPPATLAAPVPGGGMVLVPGHDGPGHWAGASRDRRDGGSLYVSSAHWPGHQRGLAGFGMGANKMVPEYSGGGSGGHSSGLPSFDAKAIAVLAKHLPTLLFHLYQRSTPIHCYKNSG